MASDCPAPLACKALLGGAIQFQLRQFDRLQWAVGLIGRLDRHVPDDGVLQLPPKNKQCSNAKGENIEYDERTTHPPR